MGVQLSQADGRTEGQTNMTKPIDAFHSFANPLKKGEVNKANTRSCTTLKLQA